MDAEMMAIFDSLPGFLCFLKNRAGEHLYASGLWTTRHGFREAWEMLFKTDQDLTPGVLAQSYTSDDVEVYRTGKPLLDKIEICLDAVGLPDWHVTSKYPVRNRKGDIIGILGVSRDIAAVAKRARDSKLTMDDLTGGTFTITNGGVFGSLISTPIINYPQVAILGLHKTQDRPIALNGQVVIRPMMYIALSYDHRIIDGQQAVLFLVKVKELMEDPASMLID